MAPGDIGWMLHRHGVLYQAEFGYPMAFERYVAEGIAPVLAHFDPALDQMWVAWSDGRRLGTVAVHHDPQRQGWAKLRWFLVEPAARGVGLGRALLEQALSFASRAGYDGVYLWTVTGLEASRRLYESAGFTLARRTDSCPWMEGLCEERWERSL